MKVDPHVDVVRVDRLIDQATDTSDFDVRVHGYAACAMCKAIHSSSIVSRAFRSWNPAYNFVSICIGFRAVLTKSSYRWSFANSCGVVFGGILGGLHLH